MIYFLSFQSVLPIVWEGFEDEKETETERETEPTVNPEFLNKIDENLKRKSDVFPEETPEPTKKLILSYGTDKALKLK